MKKEKWNKPKLVILHRGPEEAVLNACKGGASVLSPESANAEACIQLDIYAVCGNCNAITAS